MLYIGYYQALVRYIYVRDADGSIHEYAPDLVLGINQYYVYALSLNYEPAAVTVVASPTNYLSIVKEFSANVSTVNTIPLIPQAQSQTSPGLIDVVVNDPYNAGWVVVWSYSGQSYSVSQSQSYTWFINPPYVPIQISFTATITQNPSGHQCQIQPSYVSKTYSAGDVQTFNVTCTYAPPGSGGGGNGNGGGGGGGGNGGGGGGGGNSYTVTVYVNAPSGVSWTVYLDQVIAGSLVYIDWWSGTGNGGPYTATVSSGLTYEFVVKNLPSGCSASGSPYGIGQTWTPTGSFTETITITCQNNNQPPPPQPSNTCTYSYSASANVQGVSVSCGGPSSEPVGSGIVGTYSCSAPPSYQDSQGDVYQFSQWSVSVSPSGYAWSGTTDWSVFNAPLYCPSPASVSISGYATYTFQKCSSYTVTFSVSSTLDNAQFSWSFCPKDPATSWKPGASPSGNDITTYVYVYAQSSNYGYASFKFKNVCPNGVQSASTSPSGTQPVNLPSTTGSGSFSITYTCKQPPKGN
jgi:hypothetical protein